MPKRRVDRGQSFALYISPLSQYWKEPSGIRLRWIFSFHRKSEKLL